MEVKNIINLMILDASGSMESIYNQALSGVNETIQTIRMVWMVSLTPLSVWL